ncbi:restriction endonuclease [Pseudoalteromonas sp. L23]|uniref:ATP-binding protein n=1 Tax=unclassified Pseudoalteromonas TaxID=194690 RepID=UPI001EF0CDC0|nr:MULTISPECIES: ATP-binding protein [unclassified Pseudoalteromonas]MCF7512717.1 restriction endonuclease [Pseudoalteromonas sp. L7]MCF7524069.1 restriction endonuclease [Pseudoalteromonas sp. L23]MCX2769693.1 ATP-binding protein [Pseudoalteromonas sp. B530]
MTNLANLSHIDFEELCIDIIQKETQERFSSFGPGADGGIDGRHSKGDNLTIIQCKHYIRSNSSDLIRAAAKELPKIHKLGANKYIFLTSYSLTPALSDRLQGLFSPYIENVEIWGAEDIQSALRKNPDILKSHIKLWLTDSAILDKILHSGLESFTAITKEEIIEESKVYVVNPSYDDASTILNDKNTLVISGPPGVGKTTLAKMVCYQYLKDGWSFQAINSLEQGYARVHETEPTIFFFDDFLGKIELNRKALVTHESALATFVRKIQRSNNSKFVLTTRSHIYEEARTLSDNIDSQRFELSKFVLNVGLYTRKIKAHILFNHLSISEVSSEHISKLLEDDWLRQIIDHENYNPRVISHMSSENIALPSPQNYPQSILSALENPSLIWEKAFKQLPVNCRHLLITLFFCDEYLGTEIEDLKGCYIPLHRLLSEHYSTQQKPGDFEEAIKVLESGFISISNTKVSFVNPSVQDFLKAHLKNDELIFLVLSSATRVRFVQKVWHHINFLSTQNLLNLKASTFKYESLFPLFLSSPVSLVEQENEYTTYKNYDLYLSDRISLLLNIFFDTSEIKIIDAITSLLLSDSLALDVSRDSRNLPEIHADILEMEDISSQQKIALLNLIENKICHLLSLNMDIEDLVSTIEYLYEFMPESFTSKVQVTINSLISDEILNVKNGHAYLEDLYDVDLYLESFKKITDITKYNTDDIITFLESMAVEMEEAENTTKKSSNVQRSDHMLKSFSDTEMKSLFNSLIK